jgi:lactate racemase
MNKSVFLKYGTGQIPFVLPGETEFLQIEEPEKRINREKFEALLICKLRELNPDLTNIAIVVADKTRLCGYPTYLPILLNILKKYGAKPDNITIFIAYGTHSRQTDKECVAAYGRIYSDYCFVHHECGNGKLFKKLGETTRKNPVYVRRDIIKSGFVITFGAISHHYFAGYGGGRKLLFPGLGLKDAIYQNHSLFLDKDCKRLSPYCTAGVLDKNQVSEDLEEIETFKPADLAIHGILNAKGNVCDLLFSTDVEGFRNACKEHGKNCEIPAGLKKYDLVVGSCGGYPKDINFIQSHKGIENAAGFVRDRGSLIFFAKCPEQIGSETFLQWFKTGSRSKAFSELAGNYQGNGGTALSVMFKTERTNIFLVTDLSDSIVKTTGIKKVSITGAQEVANRISGNVAVIPNASLVVGKN